MKKVLTMMCLLVMLAAPVFASGSTEKSENGEKTYKVGVTIQSLENSYWAGVFGEVQQLMDEKGWEYTVLSCNDNSATQINQIENFITNGVDMIMVHPSDPNALEDYLATARKQGIKVMSWDDKMENTDVNWVLDNTKLGNAIGSAAADFIKAHYTAANPVDVAIINYPQTPILLERENGIKQGLAEGASGLYNIVASQPGIDAQTALSSMESILQAYPHVGVVCTIGAGGDIGANQALLTKYNNAIPENVGIFSADATLQQLKAIMNNEASRASAGFEGSNKKTAAACVALYEKLLTGAPIENKDIYRPITVIDKTNAAQFIADYE